MNKLGSLGGLHIIFYHTYYINTGRSREEDKLGSNMMKNISLRGCQDEILK